MFQAGEPVTTCDQHDAMATDREDPPGDIFRPEARYQRIGLWFRIPRHDQVKLNYRARFRMPARSTLF
jgi:hypothetical protein